MDSKLDYKNFMEKVPTETKELIEKAIEIYYILNSKTCICDTWQVLKKEERALSSDDKIVLSLFLAGLLVDGEVQEMFTNTGVTPKLVYDYLGVDKITPVPIEEVLYSYYYDKNFKNILYKILKDKNTLTDGVANFIPESLIASLPYKFSCGSDVVNWVFKREDENKEASDHPSFISLKALLKAKVTEQKLSRPKEQAVSTKTREKFGNSSGSYIDSVGTNLNDEEYFGNPALGREAEIKDLIIALMTPETSAMLVGEPATGKTAIVEGLAYLLKQGNVPQLLNGKKIIKINVSSLVAGTMYRGAFEEKIEQILQEASKNPDIIIFLDEIHLAIGAGSASQSSIDLANILKPYLDRGKVKIIGATTEDEYEKFVISDEAFKRRFERINVLEPDLWLVADILASNIGKLEKVTGVKFDFSEDDGNRLVNFIAQATNKQNRNPQDNVNNPDLAKKIFNKAFVLASYENSDTVRIKHFAESLRRSARLNQATRERLAKQLETKFVSSVGVTRSRVIPFPGTISTGK